MAETTIKLSQITKDFAQKGKDVLDLLKANGLEKKSGATLNVAEFSLFLWALTEANQIENLEDYLDGKARILCARPEEAPKVEEATTEEKKAEAEAPAAPTEAPAVPKPEEKKAEEKKPAEPEKPRTFHTGTQKQAPVDRFGRLEGRAPFAETKKQEPKSRSRRTTAAIAPPPLRPRAPRGASR